MLGDAPWGHPFITGAGTVKPFGVGELWIPLVRLSPQFENQLPCF
jgi:hypothetical protein